jgi:hypothetical protein
MVTSDAPYVFLGALGVSAVEISATQEKPRPPFSKVRVVASDGRFARKVKMMTVDTRGACQNLSIWVSKSVILGTVRR